MASFIEQNTNYWIVEGEAGGGNALVIKSSWSSCYLDLIEKYNIKIIRLNDRLGWKDSDISFLSSIPGIHGFDLMSDNVTDVSPVFKLKKLKTVSLFCKAKIAGDFAELASLKSVGLGWRNVYGSIFDIDALMRINIVGFPNKDLARWKTNEKLKELRLESERLENLTGIERFPNLNQLHIHRCPNLKSLESIASAPVIQKLRVSKCAGISDLSPISHLTDLKALEIEDCGSLQSVVPIANCKKLELLQISGNTNIVDGDFNAIKKLPKLKRVLLAQKRHYSHTADDLEKKH